MLPGGLNTGSVMNTLNSRADATLGALFLEFAKIGLCGIGSLLAWAHRVIVDERHWMSEAEFAETLSLCQFLPGPENANISMYVGSKFRGPVGATVAFLGLTAAPKPDGRQRPLAVAALEDKVVQRATAAVLNAIYEEDFLGFSYGFRPGRGAHDAMDALVVGTTSKKVNFILDADVASFFDSVSKDWLVRFVEHRIGDLRIIRLIQKWLKAGVLENGVVTVSEKGTGQGSVISPLLANVYLHYVFDLWAERWRRHEATGDMILVRYADDIVVGFEHEADARGFRDDLRKRLEEFSLSLNPDKTRLIEFGRFAAERRARRGLGQPGAFHFF